MHTTCSTSTPAHTTILLLLSTLLPKHPSPHLTGRVGRAVRPWDAMKCTDKLRGTPLQLLCTGGGAGDDTSVSAGPSCPPGVSRAPGSRSTRAGSQETLPAISGPAAEGRTQHQVERDGVRGVPTASGHVELPDVHRPGNDSRPRSWHGARTPASRSTLAAGKLWGSQPVLAPATQGIALLSMVRPGEPVDLLSRAGPDRQLPPLSRRPGIGERTRLAKQQYTQLPRWPRAGANEAPSPCSLAAREHWWLVRQSVKQRGQARAARERCGVVRQSVAGPRDVEPPTRLAEQRHTPRCHAGANETPSPARSLVVRGANADARTLSNDNDPPNPRTIDTEEEAEAALARREANAVIVRMIGLRLALGDAGHSGAQDTSFSATGTGTHGSSSAKMPVTVNDPRTSDVEEEAEAALVRREANAAIVRMIGLRLALGDAGHSAQDASFSATGTGTHGSSSAKMPVTDTADADTTKVRQNSQAQCRRSRPELAHMRWQSACLCASCFNKVDGIHDDVSK